MTYPSDLLSQACAELIEAEKNLALISSYAKSAENAPAADFSVHLSWNWASGMPGYKETEGAVRKLVVIDLPKLLAQVLSDAESRVVTARASVRREAERPC